MMQVRKQSNTSLGLKHEAKIVSQRQGKHLTEGDGHSSKHQTQNSDHEGKILLHSSI